MASNNSIHISIVAEKVVNFMGLEISNAMLGSSLVIAVLFILGIYIRTQLRPKNEIPSKPQLFMESTYQFLENVTSQSAGKHRTRRYLGLVIVLFFYIIFGSWFGLLPGILQIGFNEVLNGKEAFIPLFRAPTTDLNATTALALVAFGTIQYAGFSELGFKEYIGKFFNFTHAGTFVLGMLELIFEFVRIISFSFRLFGNIFAGEVLLAVIGFLSTITIAGLPKDFATVQLPFSSLVIVMEFFVALIQAYVFINLMTVFISVAAEPHYHDEKHEQLRDELGVS